MSKAENIAIIGDADRSKFKLMAARAERESISEEYEGYGMWTYKFTDGSVLQVGAGHMKAIEA